MLLTFYLTFAAVGPVLSEIMSRGIGKWTEIFDELLFSLDASDAVRSLIIN